MSQSPTMIHSRFNREIAALLVIVCSLISHIALAADDSIKQCAQQKVAFDGIKPLKYADITGEPNSHIALLHEHPALCASADDQQCKGKAYLIPGNTVAVANTCGDYAHVQYIGEQTVNYGWVLSKQLKQINEKLPFDDGAPPGIVGAVEPKFKPRTIKMKLVRGLGVPVCEAYLQRLNQTMFHQPPYCGRPENDQVPGFSRLQREWLVGEQTLSLYGYVNALRAYGEINTPIKMNKVEIASASEGGDGYKAPFYAWRYEPKLDIENNNLPDNVIVWGGSRLTQMLSAAMTPPGLI